MRLNTEKWKGFIIQKLFKLENGKANQGMLEDGDECFYIGAKKDDNGVMIHCMKDSALMQKGNCIIFICNGQGSVGYANYMDVDFIGTTDIVAGYNENLNANNGVFIATVLCQERPKYSFGRKWKTHLKNTTINLPIRYNMDGTPFIDDSCQYSDEGYVPDWQYMEDYIKSLHHKPLTTENKYGGAFKFDVDEWEEFNVNSLFSISIAKSADIGNLEEGRSPFIGRTDTNNGIQGFVEPKHITKGHCITISMVGTNVALYQENDFQASQNIAVLRSEKLTTLNSIFICTVINFEMNLKYSYGRTVGKSNIENMVLRLPILRDFDGEPIIDDTHKYSKQGFIPDWQWMENYIKALPYGDRM